MNKRIDEQFFNLLLIREMKTTPIETAFFNLFIYAFRSHSDLTSKQIGFAANSLTNILNIEIKLQIFRINKEIGNNYNFQLTIDDICNRYLLILSFIDIRGISRFIANRENHYIDKMIKENNSSDFISFCIRL